MEDKLALPLRDRFAVAAMEKLIGKHHTLSPEAVQDIACTSYRLADAMLHWRYVNVMTVFAVGEEEYYVAPNRDRLIELLLTMIDVPSLQEIEIKEVDPSEPITIENAYADGRTYTRTAREWASERTEAGLLSSTYA